MKTKNMKKKGISLIVLVITIIVMIVLAASIILSLNNAGIINKANQAVEETDLAHAKYLAALKWTEAYLDDSIADKEKYVTEELAKQGITKEKFKITFTENGVDVELKDSGNTSLVPDKWKENITAIVDGVPIPKYFTASPYDGENTKDGGLVIYELGIDETAIPSTETHYDSLRNRNQYVWVPVEDFSKFVRQSFGLEDIVDNETPLMSNVLGKDCWELALDTKENMPLKEQDMSYITSDTLKEVQAMYASVKEYKGFYIARYEAGIYEQRTERGTAINLPMGRDVHSRMSTWPYVYIPWTWNQHVNEDTNGAVEVARSMYPDKDYNISGVVSTLIYGVQWDATLQWWLDVKAKDINGNVIDVNNSIAYGNYSDHEIKAGDLNELSAYATFTVLDAHESVLGSIQLADATSTKPKNTAWALSTGALKAAKVNNIYDMAGNMLEWTMEGFDADERVMRSGSFAYSGGKPGLDDLTIKFPLTGRWDAQAANATEGLGFRVALYIKK